MNPRKSNDNLSKIILFGKHRHLGDKHEIDIPQYENRAEFEFHGAKLVKQKLGAVSVTPIQAYCKGGLSLSTDEGYPFNCRWDSGTIGFLVLTKEDIRKHLDVKVVTAPRIAKAKEIAKIELRILNDWINNDDDE